MTKKVESFILLVLSSAPLIWVGWLTSYAVRALNYLGYWPASYNPDPKVLPFHFHHSVLFIGIYVVLMMLVVLVGTRIFFTSFGRSSTWRNALVVCVFGCGLVLMLAFVPPINFAAWFLD